MENYDTSKKLLSIYSILLDRYGNRGWWPADTPFETIIGTILTQNVSWNNAKKAIDNLKMAKLLDPYILKNSELGCISRQIISSRYYNQKAQKISTFVQFLYSEYNGNLDLMVLEDLPILRKKLLSLKGFGEETVDSIILYACNLPIFVVDSYTKRIFNRYGFFSENCQYSEVQCLFTLHLPKDVKLYNDYHAQIVNLGNSICKIHPTCYLCPIRAIAPGIECEYSKVRKI